MMSAPRCVAARALLEMTLALLAADRGSSQRRLGAQLRRCAHPRGGALARRRLTMPAASRVRCAMHAASLVAPVLHSSVLVLPSTQSSLYSPLTTARASAASVLSRVTAPTAQRRSRSPPARHAGGGSRSLRDTRGVAHGARAALVGACALLDPILALLTADRSSSQLRLSNRLRRCARLLVGILAGRRLVMQAAARTRCAMYVRRSWRPCCVRRCSCFPRPNPRSTRR